MGWNFYNASGELQINDGGVQAASAVFTGNVDLGSNLLVGNAGSTGIAISANGEVTMTSQPLVMAYNSSDDANVTGNNTTATVDFDTEVKDQNADFASDTLTAPVTGSYLICYAIRAADVADTATLFEHKLVASNRNWAPVSFQAMPDGIAGIANIGGSAIVDMDADDTLTITLRVNGQGSDNVDISGSSTVLTYVTAALLA